MKLKNIFILGAGGFAKEVAWLIEENNKIKPEWNILGFIDDSYPQNMNKILGYQVIGNDEWLLNITEEIYVVCAVASSRLREKIVSKFIKKRNILFPSIISKRACVSDYVKIGKGCIICTNSILSVDIKIDDFVAINNDCTVGHDSVLESFTTLYPSVNVSGNCVIGEVTEIGTGAHIIQGLNVGTHSIIGAGTVVIRDIPDSCVAVGNPARVIKNNY